MVKKYLSALKLSWLDFSRHLIVLPAMLLLSICYLLLSILFSKIGVAGGFLMGLLQVLALSYYYNWVCQAKNLRPLRIKELTEFNYPLFLAILNVAFVLFIANLFLRALGDSLGQELVWGIKLIIFIAFNALPEVIVRYQFQGFESFKESLSFMQRYALEWSIPVLIFILPNILTSPRAGLILLASGDPLAPFLSLLTSVMLIPEIPVILLLLATLPLAHLIMLFRRRLFEQL